MLNIAFYIRISVDDDIGNDESYSVTNQRIFLSDYLKKKAEFDNCNIVEYCDDGYTGTNFQRPQFRKMLKDIRVGLINCIIVKDFSRFARNYIDITDYLCNYFPLNNIRFISINDTFDSKYDDPTELNVSFKNLMYDFYSKDISQKVRSGVYTLMKKGNFIGSAPMYGYKIDNTGTTRKLVPDAKSSVIVKRVFDMLLDGYTPIEIASIFNDEKILTPSQYKEHKGYRKKGTAIIPKPFWNNKSVRDIANNIQYTGKLVNAKKIVKEIGGGALKILPKDNHIITENAHEPIVSLDVFEKAQTCIRGNYKKNYKTQGNKQSERPNYEKQIFVRKVKCAHCGYVLSFTPSSNPTYVCKNGTVGYSENCNHVIAFEKDIVNVVKDELEKYIKTMIQKNKVRDAKMLNEKMQSDLKKKHLTKLKKSLNGMQKVEIKNYESYLDEIITRKQYEEKQAEIENRINEINQQISEVNDIDVADSDSLNDSSFSVLSRFIDNKDSLVIDRLIADQMIKEIVILSDKKFEITWKFKDIFSCEWRKQ